MSKETHRSSYYLSTASSAVSVCFSYSANTGAAASCRSQFRDGGLPMPKQTHRGSYYLPTASSAVSVCFSYSANTGAQALRPFVSFAVICWYFSLACGTGLTVDHLTTARFLTIHSYYNIFCANNQVILTVYLIKTASKTNKMSDYPDLQIQRLS